VRQLFSIPEESSETYTTSCFLNMLCHRNWTAHWIDGSTDQQEQVGDSGEPNNNYCLRDIMSGKEDGATL
jgi:hypothetical protein